MVRTAKTIILSARLQTVADFIEDGAAVADIGTDHGYLPVYLALTRKAKRIIASDISAGSLGAAQRSAEKYGVSHLIEFVVAPGLSGIGGNCGNGGIGGKGGNGTDTIVIAGVGGETIIGILRDTPWAAAKKRLILQPQTKTDELLEYLEDIGRTVEKTAFGLDKGRRYMVISVPAKPL